MVSRKKVMEFKQNITKEELEELYCDKKMTMNEIADFYEVDFNAVGDMIHGFKIKRPIRIR